MADRQLQSIQDTIRIPFYQTPNIHGELVFSSARRDQVFQNLVPQFAIDSSNQSKEQYLTKRPGIKSLDVDFMTGIVADKTQCTLMDAIVITALYDVVVVAVFDDSTNKIHIICVRPGGSGSTNEIGNFTPTASRDDFLFLTEYTQASGGSTFPAVAVSWTNQALTASKGYYATSSSGTFGAGTLTEITDTDFPPKQTPALISIGKFVWLNGRMYIASLDGRIHNCALNDLATWDGGVVAAQAYPDQCMGLERYKHHVVAFGRDSIEFFNDVGNEPGPLEPTQQAFIKFGAKSPRTTINCNDVLYWISYGKNGVGGLWMLDGYTPVKISTPYIDRWLSGVYAAGDIQSFNIQTARILGKAHLIINGVGGNSAIAIQNMSFDISTLPTGVDEYPLSSDDMESNIWCYNLEDNTWWALQVQGQRLIGLRCAGTQFASPNNSSFPLYYDQILFYCPYPSELANTHSHQYLYRWSDSGSGDTICGDELGDSSDPNYPILPITTVAQTNQLWFGNEKRKRINKCKIIMDVPLQNDSPFAYSMYVFYYKDPPVSSGFGGTVEPVANRGFEFPNLLNIPRYYISNLGTGRAWTFAVVEKSFTNFTLRALELDIQQNSH